MRAVFSVLRAFLLAGLGLAVSACTALTGNLAELSAGVGFATAPEVTETKAPAESATGRYQVGKPYLLAGRWFKPKEDTDYKRIGLASWYGKDFHGQQTANGEVFDSRALTGAHPTLPLPSYVRVTNLENDRSVIVRVNDRGPFSRRRLIDVSAHAAELLGFKQTGTAQVRVEYVGRAPLEGDDTEKLLASYRGPKPEADAGLMLAAASVPSSSARSVDTSVAFAEETAQDPAVDAVEALTSSGSIDDRISLAFELVPDQDY